MQSELDTALIEGFKKLSKRELINLCVILVNENLHRKGRPRHSKNKKSAFLTEPIVKGSKPM
jgi:hypothetical protein